MADTGWVSPTAWSGTYTTSPFNSGTVNWGPVSSGTPYSDDGLYVHAAIGTGPDTSKGMRVSGFQFHTGAQEVPVGATINGVEFRINKYKSSTSSCDDEEVRLIDDNASPIGDNQADATGWSQTDSTVVTYGGASDLMGATLTAAIVRDSDFGMAINTISNFFTDPRIDHVEMKIHFTSGAPEIDVQGNATSIVDGDTTPTTADHTDFGDVHIDSDTTLVRTFTIYNTGTAALNLTGTPVVTISGTHAADFTVTLQAATPIATSGNDTFEITFNPSAIGTRSATVSIDNNDSDENPYTFDIEGTGIDPDMNVEDSGATTLTDGSGEFDFGNVSVGSNDSETFTVENNGTTNLVLDGSPKVVISGTHSSDYTVTAQSSSPVSASGTTTFTIQFTPGATGTRTATASIDNNDIGTPYTFDLTGNGVAPEIAVTDADTNNIADGGSFNFGNVSTSGSDSEVFTITNSGGASLTLDGTPKVAVSGTHSADFVVTAQPSSPVSSGGGTTTFTVEFTPGALGARTAALTIENDDTDEDPFNITLNGTGVAQEITVELLSRVDGAYHDITDGDSTPTTTDGTEFNETIADVSQWASYVGRITNDGTSNLVIDVDGIYVSGGNASNFSVLFGAGAGITLLPNRSRFFFIRGLATSTGTYSTTVYIENNDADEDPFTFDIEFTASIDVPETADIEVYGDNDIFIPDGSTLPNLGDGTDFGEVDTTGTRDQVYKIVNTGTVDVDIETITVSGDAEFSIQAQVGDSTLSPGETTTFTVRYDPDAVETNNATVSIPSDLTTDKDPYTFAIQATGKTPPPEIRVSGNSVEIASGDTTPSTSDHTDFGSVAKDATLDRTFTIENVSGGNLVLDDVPTVLITGSHANEFIVTNSPETLLAATESTTFVIQGAPRGNGTRSATVSIQNNDPNEDPYTYDIEMTGTGFPTANGNVIFYGGGA